MANHKDAIKRNKQAQAARLRNRADRSEMRTSIKNILNLVEKGNLDAAKAALPSAQSLLHRLARKGIVHGNNASRQISQLALAINGASA